MVGSNTHSLPGVFTISSTIGVSARNPLKLRPVVLSGKEAVPRSNRLDAAEVNAHSTGKYRISQGALRCQ